MKNKFITGFVCGAVVFGMIGAFAAQYSATDNPFPVKLNGQDINIEGYNINDETYFKLRDIADAVGGFGVSFNDNTIQIFKTKTSSESTTAPSATDIPTQSSEDTLTPYEQELSKYKLLDIIEGDWQHNSYNPSDYYIIRISSISVIKDYGSRKEVGKYEVSGNKLIITYYSDLTNLTVSHTDTFNFYNGRLYIDGSNDYLTKVNQ